MYDFIFLLIGGITGFIVGIVVMESSCNTDTALKLSNVMNASMLECVTKQVITKEQVHDIETIFHRHIEANFEHIKASHGDKWGRRMIILLCILFVLVIITNIVSALFYIKSANRKAHYTMLDIKALRQVRDQIKKLLK